MIVNPPQSPQLTTAAVVTWLRQTDFASGTYRIRTPGVYKLAESISFRPNPGNNFRPTAAQAALYPTTGAEGAYRLGFFAAITVECADVEIDLNDHELAQSAQHAQHQRFFALIELADQPFLPSQGPADFGATLDAAARLVVRNGQLGRSSHHGIHGNDNADVRLERLRFTGFEVAAVALNGPRRLEIDGCMVHGSRRDVPVLGAYSAAVFAAPVLETAVPETATIRLRGQEWTKAQLVSRLAAVVARPTAPHFKNPTGLVDGPAYGILIHRRGVAVNALLECCTDLQAGDWAQDVAIRRTCIRHIAAAPREVFGLPRAALPSTGRGRRPQVGLFGEVFDAVAVTGADGGYTGHPLADVQLLLAKHTSLTKIDAATVAWAEGDTDRPQARLIPGGDSMFHVHKGLFGLRADGVRRLALDQVTVCDLENRGSVGSTATGRWFGPGRGHPLQNDDVGYGGNQVRAVAVARCVGVNMTGLRVFNIKSWTGAAWGVELLNGSSSVTLSGSQIHDVHACTQRTAPVELPNTGCGATGLDVHEAVAPLEISRSSIGRLTGRAISQLRVAGRKVTGRFARVRVSNSTRYLHIK